MKIFLQCLSSDSKKTCEKIRIMQIERCALCDHEKYATALISPIRHILDVAEKYGFCAICAHINKISWVLDSWKPWNCVTLWLCCQKTFGSKEEEAIEICFWFLQNPTFSKYAGFPVHNLKSSKSSYAVFLPIFWCRKFQTCRESF